MKMFGRRFWQNGALENGAPEVGAGESGTPGVGVPEIGVHEIGAGENGVTDIGAPEIGAPEIGAPEVCVPEVCALEVPFACGVSLGEFLWCHVLFRSSAMMRLPSRIISISSSVALERSSAPDSSLIMAFWRS